MVLKPVSLACETSLAVADFIAWLQGVAWQHIAYSGDPPAVTELWGGRLAALVLAGGLLRQHLASGRVRHRGRRTHRRRIEDAA